MDEASIPNADELAMLVHLRASDDSAAARLQAAINLGRQLTDSGDALIERFVEQARADGLSWTQIGGIFGTSKQAAQKRYGARAVSAWPGSWSAAAARVLDHAVDDAQRLQHDYVGTEHVLVAFLARRDSVAAQVLSEKGLVRDLVLAQMSGPSCASRPGGVKVMPRLEQSLHYAQRIATSLGGQNADTEHLLAGILAVPDAVAVHILAGQGIRRDDVRASLARRLGVEPRQLSIHGARRRRLLSRA